MKVGVLSDTHLRTGDDFDPLFRIVEQHFSECAAILHAGDLVHLDPFYALVPQSVDFVAVSGNMDSPETKESLPRRRIVTLGERRIGLVHGHGAPHQVHQAARQEFSGEPVDAIVFGHSHQAMCVRHDGVLLFNPGSPTDKRFAPYGSVGVLEIGRTVTGRIIRLEG